MLHPPRDRLHDPPGPAPLITIHGFAGDRLTWFALEPLLPRDWPIWHLELPGHGEAPAAPIDGFEAMLDWAAAALAPVASQAHFPGHFVGHSLGGALAIALAARLGARSVTAIAPAFLAPLAARDVVMSLATTNDPARFSEALATLPGPGWRFPDAAAEAAFALRTPAHRAAQTSLAERLFAPGPTPDIAGAFAALACPKTLIWGEADRIAAPPSGLALHRIPHAGHIPHIEAAEAVAQILRQTVASGGPG